MTSKLARFCLWLTLASFVAPVAADEKQDLENLRSTTLNLIRLLVREGILTQDKADALIKEAEKKTVPGTSVAGAPAVAPGTAGDTSKDGKPVVRVPYVPETVKNEIREQIKQEVLAQAKTERWGDPGTLPDWIDRIRFEGDLRGRYDKEIFDKNNAAATLYPFTVDNVLGTAFGPDVSNTTVDRTRLRLRARLGLQANVSDTTSVGMRLATGTAGDAVSTNQTLGGGDSNLGKYAILLDLGYLRWSPFSAGRDWLTFWGGRMPNPWLSTELVWDEDLTFDGVAARARPWRGNTFDPFITLGAFPLKENESSKRDRWLWGTQAGFDWAASSNTRAKLGLALYDYRDLAGMPADAGSKGAADYGLTEYRRGTRQKGNTLFNIADPATTDVMYGLASNFRLVDLTGSLTLTHFSPVDVTLTADYVKNIGFNREEILARTGLDVRPQTTGYQGRITVGRSLMRSRGDWQASLAFRRLERDAVLDAFADSDWHQGGTNHKGWALVASYGLDRNSWISARWISTNQISGPPLAIDALYLDFNARF